MRLIAALLATAMCPATAVLAASTISRDGSFGPVPAVLLSASGTVVKSGTTYARIDIPEAYGRRAGNNLFHSFGVFNIGSGDAAVFGIAGPTSNVIARVSGGQPSTINGLLSLDASGSPGSAPNFFFINPNGVSFGSGAAIDVPGAFHVSTANYLKFPDGNFYADAGRPSSFSAAAPEAFGFLGGTAASVALNNRNADGSAGSGPLRLELPAGRSFDVVAGAVALDRAYVNIPGGEIRIAAVGSGAADIATAGGLPASLAGMIDMSAGQLSIDGEGGGRIDISGGRVSLGDTWVRAVAHGATAPSADPTIHIQAGQLIMDRENLVRTGTSAAANAGNILIEVAEDMQLLNGASILSATVSPDSDFSATGNAGNIQVRTSSLRIDAGTVTSQRTGIYSETLQSFGNAGDVSITASGPVAVSGGAGISTSTGLSFGHAGRISLSAATLDLDGGLLFSEALGYPGLMPGMLGIGGAGGLLDIRVTGTATLRNGGSIDSSASNGNDAGNIQVTANRLTIDGTGSASRGLTGVLAMATASTGRSGRILIDVADRLDLLQGGLVSTTSYSSANAGDLSITAGQLTIDGAGTQRGTGVFSEAFAGDAGELSIRAGQARIVNGGRVAANTYGAGYAGTISFIANELQIDGGSNSLTGIESTALPGSTGRAGNLYVTANGSVAIANGARITVQNGAVVSDPAAMLPVTLSVAAPNIALRDAQITAASTGNVAASGVRIASSDALLLDSSAITTSAAHGNGGPIAVAGKSVFLHRSQITTSVSGATGNGGNIDIAADALAMNSGFIQANTAAANAYGGTVNIQVATLLPSASTIFVGGSTPHAYQPGIAGFNVIQAAAPTGISGAITVSAPALDISGSLTRLSSQMLDGSLVAQDYCRVGTGSSLTPVGHGALPPAAREFVRPEMR